MAGLDEDFSHLSDPRSPKKHRRLTAIDEKGKYMCVEPLSPTFIAAYLHFRKAHHDTCKPGSKIDYGWYPLLKSKWAEWLENGKADLPKPPTQNILGKLWKAHQAKVQWETCEFRSSWQDDSDIKNMIRSSLLYIASENKALKLIDLVSFTAHFFHSLLSRWFETHNYNAGFINSRRGLLQCNCVFVYDDAAVQTRNPGVGSRIFVRMIRPILAGEELLVHYGQSYCVKHNIH